MQIVNGFLQAYDWGPVDGLVAWTPQTGGPQAELWFGTHPNGPSTVVGTDARATADLPILTKILAAARPLSIQIHPSAQRAAQMYAHQQADPAAPRLVSDPHGKAELLIAFEPFMILEGFRDPTVTAAAFAELGEPLAAATAALQDADLPSAIRLLLALEPDVIRSAAPRLGDAFEAAGLSEHSVATVREVVAAFPGDPGVFVASLLHSRTLQPGQAVFVDPGTVHAYVRGLGLEVMTNSDNVLRLGLTSKTIAVDEALAALDLTAQPHQCDPEDIDGIRTYAPASAPFTVQVVRDATTIATTGHARTVVCLDGSVQVDDQELVVGQGALIEAGEPDSTIRVTGVAIVAHQAMDLEQATG